MKRRTFLAVLAVASVTAVLAPARSEPTETVDCASVTPGDHSVAATGVADRAGIIRVFAVQYRQDIAYVVDAATYRRKMECLVLQYVRPDYRPDVPNLVVFNEDIGLATIATGTRGAVARALAEHGPKDTENLTGAISAFASLGATYAVPLSYYAAHYPNTTAQRLILAAATDTFVRVFMQTFSDLARRYNLYIVASNNQPDFYPSTDPLDVALLSDPDAHAEGLLGGGGLASPAYVATDTRPDSTDLRVWNTAWMWSPHQGVEPYAAARYAGLGRDKGSITADDPRANVVAMTHKTPLTSIEKEILDLTDDGDLSPENTGPFPIPALEASPSTAGRVKIGLGISLPAFQWDSDFGTPLPVGDDDPCDRPSRWMRCLDARGTTLFLQPEANPGCCWADYTDVSWSPPAWQTLSWLDSAWRAVADPTVKNIRYAVTAFMTGNLVDLAFDGQSSIFERCMPGRCVRNTSLTHVGASETIACAPGQSSGCDGEKLLPYAGQKAETLVMSPWVMDDDSALDPAPNREALRARSHALLPGSGSPFENRYLETALWADLSFSP